MDSSTPMQTRSSTSAAASVRSWPAWVFSVAVHGSAVWILASGWDVAPRGGAGEPLRSAGIVLRHVSAEGATYENAALHSTDVAANQAAPSEMAQQQVAQSFSDTQVELSANAVTEVVQPPAAATAPAAAEAGSTSNVAPQTVATRRRSSPAENYAEVSVFGVQGKGSKFVYVFDRSASMQGAPLAAAKRQLIQSLQSLDNLHQFHIIFFNHRLRSFDLTSGGRRIAFGTERNKKLAANFVGGITADGGTDRFAALKQSLAFQPDVVFFLTDADDPMSASEMAEIERIQSRIGTAICVIEFGRSATVPQNNFLIELARLSNGQYGYVNTTKLKP